MTDNWAAHMADRGVIAIRGDDRAPFLQGLISNDIHKVSRERAIYASLLSAQGKFLHDFFVVAIEEAAGPAIILDVERKRANDLLRRLTLYKLRAKVAFEDVSERYQVHALWGVTAAAAAGFERPEPGTARPIDSGAIAIDPRYTGLGLRAWLDRTTAAATIAGLGFTPAAPDDYETLRLDLGIPDGSRDIVVDKNLPLECGFDELNAIDYGKGCYVGQEMTARTHYRATIRRRLYQVEVEGALPPPGTPIMRGDSEAGEMRSGRGNRGLAFLRVEDVEAATRDAQALTAGPSRIHPTKPAWATF